jgi:hypothetical protein
MRAPWPKDRIATLSDRGVLARAAARLGVRVVDQRVALLAAKSLSYGVWVGISAGCRRGCLQAAQEQQHLDEQRSDGRMYLIHEAVADLISEVQPAGFATAFGGIGT